MKLISSQRLSKIINLIFKHGFVSITCGSIEYCLFLTSFFKLKCSLNFSYIISFLFATFLGYLLHNYYTFKIKKITYKSSSLYIFQSLWAMLIGLYVLKILNLFLSIPLAKFLQLCITFFFNLSFGRYITFNRFKKVK